MFICLLYEILTNHDFTQPQRDGKSGLRDMIIDIKRFLLASKNEIEKAPLQVYRSALIFAPQQSICRKKFQRLIPRTFSRLPKVKESWNPLLQELDNRKPCYRPVITSDGETLAVLSVEHHNFTVNVWNLKTGTLLNTIDCGDWVSFLTLLPGDKCILCYVERVGVRIRDIDSGILCRTVPLKQVDGFNMRKWRDHLFCSLSSKGCLAVMNPNPNIIDLVHATEGVLQKINVSSPVSAAAWSPDGAILAISLVDGGIRFWDAGESRFIEPIKQTWGTERRFNIQFSQDGALLTETSLHGSVLIQLWDWRTGTLLFDIVDDSLQLEEYRAFDFDDAIIRLSPNEKTLTILHTSSGLHKWDCTTGQHLIKIPRPPSGCVQSSPNGELLVVAIIQEDSNVLTEIYDSEAGTLLMSLVIISDNLEHAITPDGRTLVSTGSKGIVRLWDLSSEMKPVKPETPQNDVERLLRSPDHQFVISVSTSHVCLWEIKSGSLLRVVHREDPEGIADMFGQVMINDYRGPIFTEAKMTVEGMNPEDTLNELVGNLVEGFFCSDQETAISSDGRLLAAAFYEDDPYDGSIYNIKLRDIITGNVAQIIPRNYRDCPSMSFSPGGRILAIGWSRPYISVSYIGLWDVTKEEFLYEEDTGLGGVHDKKPYYTKVFWSADATKVAIEHYPKERGFERENSLFVFDLLKEKRLIIEYPGKSAALSPDGGMVITRDLVFNDRILSLWKINEDHLALVGEPVHHYLDDESVIESNVLNSEGNEAIFTGDSRIDIQSFLPDWDPKTSRQIQLKDGWIIYGPEKVLLPIQYRLGGFVVTKDNVLIVGHQSGEVTFWEFADEDMES